MNEKSKIEGLEQGLIDIDKLLKKPGECNCGGKYVYKGLGRYQCESCGDIFLNEYAIVREFVDKYGTNYSIIEIAEKTGVSKKLIDMFVKDGKFVQVEKQRVCIICHQPIATGVYCKRCALQQIDEDMKENRRRNMQGTVTNENMKGIMHHGRQG